MTKKFTQKEFIERHVEFLKNYSTKYRFQDLDFKSVMYMSGCKDDEFKEHMKKMWEEKYPTLTSQDWGDEYDDDDSSRGDGEGDGGDDDNEY